MTTIIKLNGSKWYGQQPDTIEVLLDVLGREPLDPTFESYGNFVNHNPVFLHKEAKEKYKGCTTISGNFMEYSHVFSIITDDAELIEKLETAIRKNQATPEYKAFKTQIAEAEQRKNKARKLFESGKISLMEMYSMGC
jgi:glutamate synthase domain-containing protein 2